MTWYLNVLEDGHIGNLLLLTISGTMAVLLVIVKHQQHLLWRAAETMDSGAQSLLKEVRTLRSLQQSGTWIGVCLFAYGSLTEAMKLSGSPLLSEPAKLLSFKLAVPLIMALAGVTGALAERSLCRAAARIPEFHQHLSSYKRNAIREHLLKWCLLIAVAGWWVSAIETILMKAG